MVPSHRNGATSRPRMTGVRAVIQIDAASTAQAEEWSSSSPRYRAVLDEPSIVAHMAITPPRSNSWPAATADGTRMASCCRRRSSDTTAASAPTKIDAARVSVPMYTRVGLAASNSTSMATKEATMPTAVTTPSWRRARFPRNTNMAIKGHST